MNENEENKEDAGDISGQGLPFQLNQPSHEQANSDRVLAPIGELLLILYLTMNSNLD